MNDPRYAYPYPAQGAASDGTTSVCSSTTKKRAGFSRRMPRCSVLLLSDRRVLLRSIRHMRQLNTFFQRFPCISSCEHLQL
ncbi:hypothetical protein C4D60_Mb07t17030 [Musa balbisiana]|uniref:Uncharacterized protein n=1 Tax=Musa balbisiana TaxID=52838 RepID=A0A4S8JGL4_MUSBA|nr:hypothetical protein C4D60_Mb07t17030 [Musa balbisiana]